MGNIAGTFWDNFTEAAERSSQRKAIGTLPYPIPDGQGKSRKVQVIMGLSGDGMIHYYRWGIPIRTARPSEVDAVKEWEPF